LIDGWRLATARDAHALGGRDREIEVTAGWQAQELPDHGGMGIYHRVVQLRSQAALRLELPIVAGCVEVTWNGRWIGSRGWAPHRYHVKKEHTTAGDNQLQIVVTSPAANHYYAGTGMRSVPEPAGLLAPPQLSYLTG
jgi:hypothetical protein